MEHTFFIAQRTWSWIIMLWVKCKTRNLSLRDNIRTHLKTSTNFQGKKELKPELQIVYVTIKGKYDLSKAKWCGQNHT